MREGHTLHIDAAPALVWDVLMDVERWPDWTPTMQKVERLDSGAFGMGSEARITIRRIPPSVWRVTEFDAGRSFTWETTSGMRVSGMHSIAPEGDGTRLELEASATGVLALLMTPLFLLTTRGNVRREAEGLKRHCEQLAAAART